MKNSTEDTREVADTLPSIMRDAWECCDFDMEKFSQVSDLVWRSFDAGVKLVRQMLDDGIDPQEVFQTLLIELDRPE